LAVCLGSINWALASDSQAIFPRLLLGAPLHLQARTPLVSFMVSLEVQYFVWDLMLQVLVEIRQLQLVWKLLQLALPPI